MAWGYLLALDLYGCPREKVTDPSNIFNFKNELILAVNMKSYGKAQLEHFANHCPEAAGYTLTQMIETSALVCHFAENEEKAFIDLFSCLLFDPDVAIKIAQKYFEFTSFNKMFVERGKGKSGKFKVSNHIIRELNGEMGRMIA